MSVAEKAKLRDTFEQIDRIKENQKRIDKNLQKIKIDEFRQRLTDAEAALEQCISKEETGDKFVEVQQAIN